MSNPKGRPRETEGRRALTSQIEALGEEAVKVLKRQLKSDNDKAATAAAVYIIDRICGKPTQQTESRVEIDSRIAMRAEIRAALVAEAEGRLTAIDAIDAMPAIDGAQSTD